MERRYEIEGQPEALSLPEKLDVAKWVNRAVDEVINEEKLKDFNLLLVSKSKDLVWLKASIINWLRKEKHLVQESELSIAFAGKLSASLRENLGIKISDNVVEVEMVRNFGFLMRNALNAELAKGGAPREIVFPPETPASDPVPPQIVSAASLPKVNAGDEDPDMDITLMYDASTHSVKPPTPAPVMKPSATATPIEQGTNPAVTFSPRPEKSPKSHYIGVAAVVLIIGAAAAIALKSGKGRAPGDAYSPMNQDAGAQTLDQLQEIAPTGTPQNKVMPSPTSKPKTTPKSPSPSPSQTPPPRPSASASTSSATFTTPFPPDAGMTIETTSPTTTPLVPVTASTAVVPASTDESSSVNMPPRHPSVPVFINPGF